MGILISDNLAILIMFLILSIIEETIIILERTLYS